MSEKRGKIILAQPGGGGKTEIRVGRGQGWLVLEFTYDENGQRNKVGEHRSAKDGFVLQLMRQDPEFWDKFVRLASHPYVQNGAALDVDPDQLELGLQT